MDKFTISLWGGWRLALVVIAGVGMVILPFKPSFPYAETLLLPYGSPLFWSWANFDGVHYIGIAEKSYFAQFTQAFFPLYPLLIRALNQLVHNSILNGLIISNVSFLGSLWLLYKLARLDLSASVARRTLIFLLVFPTSFFFASLYTESLFLLVTLASFYAARQRRWLLAGVCGALAAATRILGILLIPALLIEYLASPKRSRWDWWTLLLPAAGLLLYMYYLNVSFHDPLYFLHAQPAFGAGRSGDKIILLYQVFWRYLKMLRTVPVASLVYYTVAQEFIAGLVFLCLSLLAFKFTRRSYAVFGILAYILPTLTGTFSSMPRYGLVLFPAFLILGRIKNQTIRHWLYAISLMLLIINVVLFTRGYWVA
ncbi:MAG: hypothetical protein A2784_02050 [Candidatus Chisholmbacteria bacterium RIFCSPHIGHO2_01_FULL_48_12]|uniref:Glycosyltransferase RgtA/B/C/D-like domain-containing protein n=1 Tax=Candidatus Chisholmbacteria bacterium RIFCSPHIGHO2_01_FULL_48_12 TaxID=1797589 RepID=A0A1G1VPC9_9BACT|nr:MAG: hypothetical protein A2784_02050 [Candidatus Chisholmbacteria bacterium RIFCSPHIGHO2_01_FULL_48_12]